MALYGIHFATGKADITRDTKPLAPNKDEEGRAKNRWVELSKL